VIDGDTLLAEDQHFIHFRVRLLGVDAPECGMPFGHEAQRYLENLVLGMTVQLVRMRTDRHGRQVAIVTIGGRDVGLAMLGAGLAWHDERFHKPRRAPDWGAYRDAWLTAQARGLGLWVQRSPTPPWLWREAQGTSPRQGRCPAGPRGGAKHPHTSNEPSQDGF
jgi:endonuclease YncB( thermonuclease family)